MTRLIATSFTLLFSLCLFGQQHRETTLLAFGSNEDFLSASAKTKLAEITEKAQAADIYSVELFGHTDQQGDEQYNAALARRRALAVEKALTNLGLDEGKIEVSSFGESRLLESENNEIALAKNRRVELTLTTEKIRTEARLFEVLAASRTHIEKINHDQVNQLIGEEGVTLSIPENAFVFADGRLLPPGAQVELTLEEATRPSSMMAHRLSTNGKNGRLSTGGMVRVTGHYQGQTLHLASGKAIDVEIPTQAFDDEMRLYVGERQADEGMNWNLDTGESVKTSTRIVEGSSKRKRILDADEIAILEEIKAALAKRNRFLAMMNTERLEQYTRPFFPEFKALPKVFNPKDGIPKRPFIPEAPTRKIAKKNRLFSLKGESQRKLDEKFISDSIAYAKELPTYNEKLASFAKQLVRFEEDTPNRAIAHQVKVDEVIDLRVKQAQRYLLKSTQTQLHKLYLFGNRN